MEIERYGESKRRDMHGHRKSDGYVSSYNVLWKAAGRGVQSGAGIFPECGKSLQPFPKRQRCILCFRSRRGKTRDGFFSLQRYLPLFFA